MSNYIIDYFSEVIKKEIGILYLKENQYQLKSRLEDICKQLKFESTDHFYEKYKELESKNDPTLKKILLDTATNNETKFFRDTNAFKAIRSIIEEKIDSGMKHINIWSAACSTGQECYSVAMILHDIKKKGRDFTYSMLATDFSKRVLKEAREGLYTQLQVQRGLNAMQLLEFFNQIGDGDFPSWQVNDNLKKHIKFSELNLIKDWNIIDKFDLILCRNVLIYQNTQNREAILTKFNSRLNPNGFIILGGSESMIGIKNSFKSKRVSGISVYEKYDESSDNQNAS